MATDLTEEARAGYDGPTAKNPHLFSSDAWLGFEAGRALASRTRPARAWKGRGYRVNVESGGGTRFAIAFAGDDLKVASVERSD